MSTTKIKQLLDSADKADGDVASLLQKSNTNRWEASRLISEALASKDITQVILAKEVGRSQHLMSYYNRVWKKFGETSKEMDFQEAYRWVQDNPERPRPVVAPEPEPRPEPRLPREAPVEPSDTFRELVRPQPEPMPEAERKAIRAATEAIVAPFRELGNKMVSAFSFPCTIGSLSEAVDGMKETLAYDLPPVNAEELAEAQELLAQLGQLLMELELKMSTTSI